MPPSDDLGRLEPTDWEHVDKYPLTAEAIESLPGPQPVVLGCNWYRAFDRSRLVQRRDRTWWVDDIDPGEPVRGGHAICLRPRRASDPTAWQLFYDQGTEGACVGYAWSRAMSHFNRQRYDARWLYDEARKVDEWPGDSHPGTSLRAGGEVLSTAGHRRVVGKKVGPVNPELGIAVYRWARSVDDALAVLGHSSSGFVELMNSWGPRYPHYVRMPVETLVRLWNENGELAISTDR